MPATLSLMAQRLNAPPSGGAPICVRYWVTESLTDWWLPEGTVPESATHDQAAKHLVLLLDAWATQLPTPVMIARNLAVRWLQSVPRVGIDPDVAVISPPPPDANGVDSLRLWQPGHVAPLLCFEVVSRNHPYKDYAGVHERYAAMGTQELVVFDPLLAGPRSLGGPVSLQVWRRDASGALDRVYFGPGPFRSEVLDAWLVPSGAGSPPKNVSARKKNVSARKKNASARKKNVSARKKNVSARKKNAKPPGEWSLNAGLPLWKADWATQVRPFDAAS
jgi:hypothetical protein